MRATRFVAVLAAAAVAFTLTVRAPAPGKPAAVGFVAQASAFDPVKYVWEKFRDGVLKKVVDLIRRPIEKAKEGLKALIDKAKQALQKVFESDVIIPALIWAIPKIFPKAEKFLDYVRQVVGAIDKLTAMAQKYRAAIDALIQGNKDKYQEALAGINSSADLIQNFNVSLVVDILIVAAKENAPQFIKAKTIELLDKAYSLIEAPINAGKAAACAAIGSIPIVGGILSGAADFIITEGLKLLRKIGFEFVANKAAELANKAIDAIGRKLKGLAANVDSKIAPILDKVKGFLKEAEKYVAPLKAAYAKVKMGLEMASKKGGLGTIVGVGLARTLYDEMVKLLRNNAPAAQKKLQELADKAKAVFPTVGQLVGPILDALEYATGNFADQAGRCRERITGFDKESLNGVFQCLKGVVENSLALGGFDSFVNLLKANVEAAKKKLEWLAGKLTAVLPAARTLAGPVVSGLHGGADALVTEVGACRAKITGFNRQSAQDVFACLGEAVKKAAGGALAGIARGLFDEFIALLRKGCGQATAKLGDLVSKIVSAVPQVRSMAEPVINAIRSACEGGVDKVANLKAP
jgi:phage-related protein